jgi:DNA-binding response OmpR family regulator
LARLLVADDDDDVLSLVAITLKLAGHEVTTVSDGAAAVRRAVAESPDAIVLDVMMPGVDGLTAMRQLRDTPSTRTIPVLLLSAKAGSIDIDNGMKAGAAGYVTKPFAPDELVEAVERMTREF